MSYQQNFLNLGSEIPSQAPAVPPGCNFVLFNQDGNRLLVTGYGPFWGPDVPSRFIGKLGADIMTGSQGDLVTASTGYAAARLTTINLLMIVQQAIQTLDNVSQILEVNGFVNCAPHYREQSAVLNGCSDLLVSVFGNNGMHTRSAIGAPALAMDICVEISLSLLLNI